MTEPFVGEIRIFGCNFAVRGWAFCDGALLVVDQNQALFAIIGTIYGGDGRTTLGLPDLQGRAPLGAGNGPGLNSYRLGQPGGADTVTLTTSHMPDHTHSVMGQEDLASLDDPANHLWSRPFGSDGNLYHPSDSNLVNMSSDAIESVGGGQAHENRQPFQVLNFQIALTGIFPPRS